MATNPWVVPAARWLVNKWDDAEVRWRFSYVLTDMQRYVIRSFKEKHDDQKFDAMDGSVVNSIAQSAQLVIGQPMTQEMVITQRMQALAALGYEWDNMNDSVKKISRETNRLVADMRRDLYGVGQSNAFQKNLNAIRDTLAQAETVLGELGGFEGIKHLIRALREVRSGDHGAAVKSFEDCAAGCRSILNDIAAATQLAEEHAAARVVAYGELEALRSSHEEQRMRPDFGALHSRYSRLQDDYTNDATIAKQKIDDLSRRLEALKETKTKQSELLAERDNLRRQIHEVSANDTDDEILIKLVGALADTKQQLALLDDQIVADVVNIEQLEQEKVNLEHTMAREASVLRNLPMLLRAIGILGAAIADPLLMSEPDIWRERHANLLGSIQKSQPETVDVDPHVIDNHLVRNN